MASTENTTAENDQATATLVVGTSYTYKGTRFMRGVPVPVSVELAKELEELVIGSTDSRSKRKIDQQRFEIDYSGSEEADEADEASSGAKRPITSKRIVGKKPSRATAK